MTTDLTKNHDVERIYMEQLRNIETSLYILNKKENQTKNIISQLKRPIKDAKAPNKPRLKNYLDDAVPLMIPIILVLILNWLLKSAISALFGFFAEFLLSILNILFIVCCVIGGLMFVVGFYRTIKGWFEYVKNTKKYNDTIKENEAIHAQNMNTMKNNFAKANNLLSVQNGIHNEFNKAMKIRENIYSVNWIPIQYRNIRVVYYIYDMVSTSNIGIEEALKYYLLQEANNKLDEILHKMDTIIENQNEIIMNQAIANAQNKNLIQQNKTIIEQNAEIEENTRLSADYARVGAAYAEANAYFSLANYLKRR